MRKIILLSIITALSIQYAIAQGDGARMTLWAPTGVTGVIPKWMGLNQNMTPAHILVENADLHINAFPVTAVHNFGIAGRFAQIMINAVPGSVTGSTVSPSIPGSPVPPNISVNASGFADGFIGFKLGLVNQPALNVKEFMAYKHKTFSMTSYTRVWYPGSYDQAKNMNLGSNRWTFELGLPMNIYLSKKNPKRATWLEIYPAVHIYTANTNPTDITKADKTDQLPLFTLENHLSHNFTNKFWAALDLRYQYGGEVKADGEKQDNKINAVGGGVTVGYQIIQPIGLHASYGSVFNNPSNVKANMVKITLVFTYANLKKIQNEN